MWSIALLVIFWGNEATFLMLTAALGLAGLWEYFRMIERSGTRCFAEFGMAFVAASFIEESFALRAGRQTEA